VTEGVGMIAPIFFLSIFTTILVAALAVYLSALWKKKEHERARLLAAELGFNFELRAGGTARVLEKLPDFLQPFVDFFSPWRISGSIRGHSAWIYPETRSYGKSSKTFLIVRVYYLEPLPFDFRAGRETVFTKIGKTLFNLTDVEVGDWAFDAAVRIKASDAVAVQGAFNSPAPREKLLALLEAFPESFADREGAQWEKVAVRASFALVPAALQALTAFADALDSTRRDL